MFFATPIILDLTDVCLCRDLDGIVLSSIKQRVKEYRVPKDIISGSMKC